MINTRLFQWYGIDTAKNLEITNVCPKPFDTVLIDSQGSCFICECTAWLPQSVGNLHKNTLDEVFKSATAEHLRDSIRDGSYRYCNFSQCQWLQKDIVENYKGALPKISTIRLAIDNSCNLACPSCRKSKIFHKKGQMLKMRLSLADKINDYLKRHDNIHIHIGSDGDPFASLVYRHFMREVPDNKSFTFNFQTNGLLLKKMFDRLSNVFCRLKELNISIDGATKKTYEMLRKGGNFDLLLENLEFIKQYHQHFKINFHMVVQKSNWQEMNQMINLAEKFNVNKVWFNKIQNWNSYKNFEDQLPPEKDNQFLKEYHSVKKNNKSILWDLK